jgi:hypothetical protein
VPSSTTPDRELVRALGAEPEPGMRKLIVGMLTVNAWDPEPAPDIDLSARARASRRWADGAATAYDVPADDEAAAAS